MRQYIKKKVVCFGEVLWDILPQGKRIGGAPLNVAYHLRKLGVKSCLISRVGEDVLGKSIRQFLMNNDLGCSILQSDLRFPTGKVIAKINNMGEATYKILEKVAWDHISYNESVKNTMKSARVLVYGSLAARNEASRKTLFKLLEYPTLKVLDVNLRTPFYSKTIIENLLDKANIVKMNESELQIISKWFNFSESEEGLMRRLAESFELEALIITCGAKGAYLQLDGETFFERGKKVKVVNTIGSGDAFLAGFLSYYIRGQPTIDTLQFANRIGAFISQKDGGIPNEIN